MKIEIIKFEGNTLLVQDDGEYALIEVPRSEVLRKILPELKREEREFWAEKGITRDSWAIKNFIHYLEKKYSKLPLNNKLPKV